MTHVNPAKIKSLEDNSHNLTISISNCAVQSNDCLFLGHANRTEEQTLHTQIIKINPRNVTNSTVTT